MKGKLPSTLELTGLYPAPPQQFGGVTADSPVTSGAAGGPASRPAPYKDAFASVALSGRIDEPGLRYSAYVPHGLVLSWSDDGSPVTAFGTQLGNDPARDSPAKDRGRDPWAVRLVHKMVKRESDRTLRFLPQHLAMEGFLMLYFGGPEIAWSEYSRQALRDGLDPRYETVVPGRDARPAGRSAAGVRDPRPAVRRAGAGRRCPGVGVRGAASGRLPPAPPHAGRGFLR